MKVKGRLSFFFSNLKRRPTLRCWNFQLILLGKIDMSILCRSFSTLPWPETAKKKNNNFLTYICIFSVFFIKLLEFAILYMLSAFSVHFAFTNLCFVLAFFFLNSKMQDGGSNDVVWRFGVIWRRKKKIAVQAEGYLMSIGLFRCALSERKSQGRVFIRPNPTFPRGYDLGCGSEG